MHRTTLSLFHRILFAVAAISLTVAIISGLAHYLFAARLTETSVRNQMQTALKLSRDHFERTYVIPIRGNLQLLASSSAIDNLYIRIRGLPGSPCCRKTVSLRDQDTS